MFTYAACFTLWERLLRDRCLKPYRITPIHWLMARRRPWRTHVSHIGERAIYSSDFSAFTKRSYCPSVLRFFWPKYHISNMNYPFALRRLPTVELCSPCGEVPWSIAAINHRAHDSSLAMTHTVSVLCVWGFHMHAKRFMESQNVHFVRISVS